MGGGLLSRSRKIGGGILKGIRIHVMGGGVSVSVGGRSEGTGVRGGDDGREKQCF